MKKRPTLLAGDLVKLDSGDFVLMLGQAFGVTIKLLPDRKAALYGFRGVSTEDVIELYNSSDVSVEVVLQCLEGSVHPGLCNWRAEECGNSLTTS